MTESGSIPSRVDLQFTHTYLLTVTHRAFDSITATIASRRISLISRTLQYRTMASTSSTKAPQPAPWKSAFLEDLSKLESPEFVFSSLHPAPEGSPSPYLPRARYCIFRGFWAELPENKHNEAPQNDKTFESEMPTFTSDIRMMKIPELFSSGSGHATKEEQMQGSGGGGPCEAVWWVKETGTQWRMKGEAFVVGEDIEGHGEQSNESSGVRTVKSELGSRMRIVKEQGQEDWSWSKELTAHFGNNSPGLRGEFRMFTETEMHS